MTTGKNIALSRWTFIGKVMSLLFNMLSRLVTAFLPRSKCVLVSWLHLPSAVILEPPKIKSLTYIESTKFLNLGYLVFFFFFRFSFFCLCCAGSFFHCGERGCSLVAVPGLLIAVVVLLRSTGSRHKGFGSCGSQALRHWFSSGDPGFGCPTACGIFPDQGLDPCNGRQII